MKANITAITNRESMVDELWKTEALIEERIAEKIGENEEAAKRKENEKNEDGKESVGMEGTGEEKRRLSRHRSQVDNVD